MFVFGRFDQKCHLSHSPELFTSSKEKNTLFVWSFYLFFDQQEECNDSCAWQIPVTFLEP